MTVTIRPADPADGDAIAMLFMRVWRSMDAMLPPNFLDRFDPAVQREKYAARAADPVWLLLLAEQDEQIIGMASAIENHGEPQGYHQLVKAMYVDPECQGQGIGTALFAAIVADLKSRQIQNLALWTITHNRQARRFYEQRGGDLVEGLPIPEEYAVMPHVVYVWDRL